MANVLRTGRNGGSVVRIGILTGGSIVTGFLQWRQWPSQIYLACLAGVSLDKLTLSTSMTLWSF